MYVNDDNNYPLIYFDRNKLFPFLASVHKGLRRPIIYFFLTNVKRIADTI